MLLDKTRDVASIKEQRVKRVERYSGNSETTWGSNVINKKNNDYRSGEENKLRINFLSASCFQIAVRYYSTNKAFFIDEAFQTNFLQQNAYSQLVDELIRSYKVEYNI